MSNPKTKVVMISTDRAVFSDSPVRKRMIEYGGLFSELHVIVFSLRAQGFVETKISENVTLYPTNSISKIFYIKDATRIGQKLSDTDTVVSTQDPFETGLVGQTLAKKTGAKLQIQIHTDFLSHHFTKLSLINRIRVRMAKRTLPKADSIRVVSERIKKSLHAKRYTLRAVPEVLPIFVDVKKIADEPVSEDIRLKYPQFKFIVLMVSRLTREKYIGLALEAFSKVLKRQKNVGLVIVGDGPEKTALTLKAKLLGLHKHVIFEDSRNPISYMKTAHMFLSTSLYEGYGLTLIESLACGCPVVCSDVGIANDLLKNDWNAYICPVGATECFENHIDDLFKHSEKRELFKQHGYATLETMSTKETYLENYKRLIDETRQKA
ncbi:glycosyltransferase family 4 protein [Candidatus Parcubacteria bacterium]|nr:glycosyltransferase family 4 protein [Candidatus Parcubacteria bacterium]